MGENLNRLYKMDQRKSTNILRGIKKRAVKKNQVAIKVNLDEIAKGDPGLKAMTNPFWKRIFSLGRLHIDDLHNGYLDITMALQDNLQTTNQKLWRNKTNVASYAKYNIEIKKIRAQQRIVRILRDVTAMSDQLRFVQSRDIMCTPLIPEDAVKDFLARRVAAPSRMFTMQNSVVGRHTERQQLKRQAIMVGQVNPFRWKGSDEITTVVEGLAMVNLDGAGGPDKYFYESELVGSAARIKHSSIPWFKGSSTLMTAEPLVTIDGAYYLDGVPVPKQMVVQQDGIWWVRARKCMIDHIAARGRAFAPNATGYLLKDGSVHVETEVDYDNYQRYFSPPETSQNELWSLFIKSKITDEAIAVLTTVEEFTALMATCPHAAIAAELVEKTRGKITDKIVLESKSMANLVKELTLVELPGIETLFTGLSGNYAQQLIAEAPSVSHLIRFMATVDSSIPGNKMHRLRFYAEHYKAKIVKLSLPEIFPEIFLNPALTEDARALVRQKIDIKVKKIMHYLKTGKLPAQFAEPVVKLPIQDITSNANAFWYQDPNQQLRIGILGDPTIMIHRRSWPYVDTIIPVEAPPVEMAAPAVFAAPKKDLLANNLLAVLNMKLDLMMGFDHPIEHHDENQLAQHYALEDTKQRLRALYDAQEPSASRSVKKSMSFAARQARVMSRRT